MVEVYIKPPGLSSVNRVRVPIDIVKMHIQNSVASLDQVKACVLTALERGLNSVAEKLNDLIERKCASYAVTALDGCVWAADGQATASSREDGIIVQACLSDPPYRIEVPVSVVASVFPTAPSAGFVGETEIASLSRAARIAGFDDVAARLDRIHGFPVRAVELLTATGDRWRPETGEARAQAGVEDSVEAEVARYFDSSQAAAAKSSGVTLEDEVANFFNREAAK